MSKLTGKNKKWLFVTVAALSLGVGVNTYSTNVQASVNNERVISSKNIQTVNKASSDDDMSVGEHNVDGLKYKFSADGTLTFESGTLPETNRVYGGYPWANGNAVKKVIVGTPNSKVIANKDSNGLFSNLNNLTSVSFVNVDSSKTTDMGWMFTGDSSLQSINFGDLDTSNVANMEEMFSDDEALSTVDLSSFDTNNVTNMDDMFSSTGLKTINFGSKFSTRHVTDMGFMFAWSDKLVNLDLSGFNTSSVTSMTSMFRNDTNLANVKLTKFHTPNVTNMVNMFLGNSNLKSLDLSSFDTSKVTDMGSMFLGDTNLEKLNLSSFDTKLAAREYTLSLDGKAFTYHGLDDMFGAASLGFPDDKKLSQLTLGPNTILINSVELSDPSGTAKHPVAFSDPDNPNVVYQNNQNKWQAVGDGSIDDPKGKLYSVKDLISLYSKPQPKVETYIWAHTETGSGSTTTPSAGTTTITPSATTTPETSVSPSSSSSSATTTSSSSTPTVTPTTKPSTSTQPNVAVKGEAVYATKKIGLYKSTNFTKTNRIAWYSKQKRTNRPMFVVTGYKRTSNGTLRYKVRDVNHGRKTAGKTGYITASQKYVVPVYYASVPKSKKITVVAKKGANAYKSANLTGKAKHYKKGVRLTVKKLVKHNLTTRYQLKNGKYITANKKLIIAGSY